MNIDLLKKLSLADGIPGCEDEVRKIIKGELEPFVDSIQYDKLGSIIAVKKGKEEALKIGIFGHMDEVGFIVKSIDANGFIKVFPLGSWNPIMAVNMRVTITNRLGNKIPGVMTTDKVGKDISIEDIYVETGANTLEEINELEIREGDMITPYQEVIALQNNNILGKAWDDRLGCSAMIDTIKELEETENNIYGVGTVQEEIGTRGGYTSVEVVKPDLAIIVDIATSKDTPKLRGQGRKITKGPCVVFFNKMAISNKKVYNYIIDLAKENNIDVQFDILNGGTDSGPVHLYNEGVPTVEIILPIRNAHTSTSIFNYEDYRKAVELIKIIIKNITREKLQSLLDYSL